MKVTDKINVPLTHKCIECGSRYGELPRYCHGCGCEKFDEIDEYQSIDIYGEG